MYYYFSILIAYLWPAGKERATTTIEID